MSHGVVAQVLAAAPPPAATLGGRAIHSETNWGTSTTSWQAGWRFTVGAVDIDVGALLFRDGTGAGSTETVRLWRVADSSLVASASVTAAANSWGEEEITPVTLNATEDYIVSHRVSGGSSRTFVVNPYRDAGGANTQEIIDPAITIVGNRYVNADTIPTSSAGNQFYAANFRTLAPASGYRFYRLHFTATDGGTRLRLDEVELRASVGGADETGSGAGWADDIFSNSSPGANAFNNGAGQWIVEAGVTDASLYYDFGTHDPQTIVQYTIKAATTPTEAPSAWTFEASNDLVTWDTLDTVSGETGWSSGETRTYTI